MNERKHTSWVYGAVVTGVLFGVDSGLLVDHSSPGGVGATVTCGCMFLINLLQAMR